MQEDEKDEDGSDNGSESENKSQEEPRQKEPDRNYYIPEHDWMQDLSEEDIRWYRDESNITLNNDGYAKSKSSARGSGSKAPVSERRSKDKTTKSTEQSGEKRKFSSVSGLKEPMSPESIRKSARTYLKEVPKLAAWIPEGYPRVFSVLSR